MNRQHISKEMENLRKNWKEILEIKNTEREKNNAFDGLVSGLDSRRKNFWAWGYLNRNLLKLKNKRGKVWRKTSQNIQELWDNYKRCTYASGNTKRRNNNNSKHTKEIFKAIMTRISQINVRHQTTDPGSSENTEQN